MLAKASDYRFTPLKGDRFALNTPCTPTSSWGCRCLLAGDINRPRCDHEHKNAEFAVPDFESDILWEIAIAAARRGKVIRYRWPSLRKIKLIE